MSATDDHPESSVVATKASPKGPPLVTAPTPSTPARRFGAAFGLAALVVGALFGGNVLGMREHFFGSESPEARAAAVSRSTEGAAVPEATVPRAGEPVQSVLRSQPWWQKVGVVEGGGSMRAPAFNIDPGAIQWRVTWTCQSGNLQVRAPDQRRPVIVDSACPGSGTGYGVQKGSVSVEVTATGPWRMEVDQQVDVPLDEPPLAAMNAPGATVVSTGSLYRIDQVGTGTVNIYRLPDGSRALRLENFFVTANTDLELQFSPLEAPRSTNQITDAGMSPSIATLDVTTGSLNFAVPPTLDLSQYRSLIIWCEVANSAYAAATLRPA